MANAKKCDRCGVLFEHYTKYSKNKKDINGISCISVNEYGTAYMNTDNHLFDLCPDCLESFKEWWDEHKITLSEEQVKDWESKNHQSGERTDTTSRDVNENPDPIIIQEPESDGEKYGN